MCDEALELLHAWSKTVAIYDARSREINKAKRGEAFDAAILKCKAASADCGVAREAYQTHRREHGC